MKRKGIILAGGSGTRLSPLTLAVSKQLMPVFDKPMIYYPLSVLMMIGIRDIAIITRPEDKKSFHNLLGNGSQFGIKITYLQQPKPQGLAQAFIIAKDFIKKDNCCLILGDNLFYGTEFIRQVGEVNEKYLGANIFAYHVKNPSDYGVIECESSGFPISIEEKPINPKSNYAIPGLYFYDNDVIEIAKFIKPSKRGELEITEINKIYMDRTSLAVTILGRGTVWLDTGSPQSLHDAASFVQVLQTRQGQQIACLEEIAYNNQWIDRKAFDKQIEKFKKSSYGEYLESIVK